MMSASSTLQSLSAEQRHERIRQAAHAIDAGELVILPTETVYGLGASGAEARAVARLRALTARAGESSLTAAWHAPDVETVLEAFDDLGPIHRRLITRLAPGPASFVITRDEGAMAGVRERAGLCPQAASAPECMVRIPSHPVAASLLHEASVPVVCSRLATTGWGEDRALSDAVLERAAEAGVEQILDDGNAPLAKPSTVLRLTGPDGYEIIREGAYEARYIETRLERVVLFVCTGNTCRSPMAAAIARQEIERARPEIPTRVLSAGITAVPGAPAASEAVDAMAREGIDLSGHRSQPLDERLLGRAEAVFTMTGAHRDAVLALDPTAASKTRVLDPAGEDIPDPIGQSEEVYRRTAERLHTLIRQRLEELES